MIAVPIAAWGADLRLALGAMGTRFELVVPGAAEDADTRAAAEAALEEIRRCHDHLTRFAPGGLPARIAGALPGEVVPLDPDTAALLADAVAVWRTSGGAFDPMLGAGLDALGFDPAGRVLAPRRAGLAPDFGAIAKGHALDLAARLLRAHGVTRAFLHGGTSSAIAIGAPPGRTGWGVALEGDSAGRTVFLRDRALSVSGAWAGNPHPTLDPRTGRPVPAPRRAAVLGPSARLADAWSTVALVLGRPPDGLGVGWDVLFY
jgi:FAD:protein FMN transferase